MNAVDLIYARRRRASLAQSQQLEQAPRRVVQKKHFESTSDFEFGFTHPKGHDLVGGDNRSDSHRSLAQEHGYKDQYEAVDAGLVRYWHMPVEAGLEFRAESTGTAIKHLQRRQPYGKIFMDVIPESGRPHSTEHDNWRQAITYLKSQRPVSEQHAFHGTSKTLLRAIRAVGLVPQVGANTKDAEGHDVEAKVCLAQSKSTAKTYARKSDGGGVVLAVDLDHPELTGACPQKDRYTAGSLTINQRIPPEAIRVAESFPHVPTPEEVILGSGYNQTEHRDHGRLGSTMRFVHQNGAQIILTKRQDLETPLSQHSGYEDRLKGVSGNWLIRWEHHSHDGVKSTGFNQAGLEHHLNSYHERPLA